MSGCTLTILLRMKIEGIVNGRTEYGRKHSIDTFLYSHDEGLRAFPHGHSHPVVFEGAIIRNGCAKTNSLGAMRGCRASLHVSSPRN